MLSRRHPGFQRRRDQRLRIEEAIRFEAQYQRRQIEERERAIQVTESAVQAYLRQQIPVH